MSRPNKRSHHLPTENAVNKRLRQPPSTSRSNEGQNLNNLSSYSASSTDHDDSNNGTSILAEGSVSVLEPDNGQTSNQQNNNTTEVLDLRGGTEEVEAHHIGPKTRAQYIRTLTNILLFCYDKHNNHIADYAALRAADMEDIDYDADIIERKLRKKTGLRKKLRAKAKSLIEAMNRNNRKSPFVLEGPNQLSYDTVANYMNEKGRIVETNPDLVADVNTAGIVDENGKVKCTVPLSQSIYEGTSSAIAYLYRQSNHTRPSEFVASMKLYTAGRKRKGKNVKQKLGLSVKEGKREMRFPVYEFLAKKFFSRKEKHFVFAHLFLVLDW